jgi:hypothetical protein
MDEGFDIPTADELIASVAKFLIEGGEDEAASLILACDVASIVITWTNHWNNQTSYGVAVNLSGPRVAYDVLSDGEHPVSEQVRAAIGAVLEHGCSLDSLSVRAERVGIAPDWRAELVEMARGMLVHNQAAVAEKFRLWNNLRFRSQSEIRIAEALDKLGVTFFPNCMARLTGSNRRMNMEPDFLICRGGKWGILEVDGGEFHPPERTAQEHERDRLFRAQGIMVERFDAQRCYREPDLVVAEFFRVLDRQ